MTTAPSLLFPSIDTSSLDDKMDVASSPYRQSEDIDIELESVHDPSVIEDDMVDYNPESFLDSGEARQDQADNEYLDDDDMLDDAPPSASEPLDYTMDAPTSPSQQKQDEDEDILYEDDDDNLITSHDAAEESIGLEHLEHEPAADVEHPQQEDLEDLIDVTEQDYLSPNTNQVEEATATVGPLTTALEDSSATVATSLPTGTNQPAQETLDTKLPADVQKSVDDLDASVPDPTSLPEDPDSELNGEETVTLAQDPGDSPQDLHPVTVVYLDDEMSLFPPTISDGSSLYFLSDTSLAFEPLDKLLAACREVLVGTLDHHDELVLDIPGLGLHICEDSRYAAEITLNQVLEVYLSLCHNQALEPIHPLYCQLSSRVSLASQYEYLVASGAEGKSFAEIAADHVDSPFDDEVSAHQPGATTPVQDGSDGEHTVAAEEETAVHKDDGLQQYAHDPEPSQSTAEDSQIGQVADKVQEVGAQSDAVEVNGENDQPQDGPLDETAAELDVQGASSDEHVQFTESDEHQGTHADESEYHDTGEPEFDAEAEDVFDPDVDDGQDQNDATVGSVTEDGIYDDEELFAEGEDETLVANVSSTLDPHEAAQEVSATVVPDGTEVTPAEADFTRHNTEPDVNPTTTDGLHAATNTTASPPVTPSKNKLVKRKAEEDDEFDFLDLSTPEPKRRRPS
ncbi:hypothetical protein PV10_03452 [Exophiala mesophila]|uniref:Uncharacterized protein n=1 Tax=Exophiala mesophila TaxID=212818 RepID=A0A0D1ZMH3_EXOME|nr:uncharacterized protein PV10_03452 [Exophiala mesophila]KIV95847.1 hypothetical protein PV10_03452 [Exophiala mesophila]